MSKVSSLMRYGLVLALAAVSAIWILPAVSSQSVDGLQNDKSAANITVNAKGKGFPRINFEDGR